jgi:hypothetical protein
VGSSSSSTVGWMYSARARLMRMRQPPEKELVARFCITTLNPAHDGHAGDEHNL